MAGPAVHPSHFHFLPEWLPSRQKTKIADFGNGNVLREWLFHGLDSASASVSADGDVDDDELLRSPKSDYARPNLDLHNREDDEHPIAAASEQKAYGHSTLRMPELEFGRQDLPQVDLQSQLNQQNGTNRSMPQAQATGLIIATGLGPNSHWPMR